jgi:hypothetical protein
VQLKVFGAGSTDLEEELRALQDWLIADRSVSQWGIANLACSEPPKPGEQSMLFDIVEISITSAFSATSLGFSIATWRSSRSTDPSVTVERPDGVKVTISDSDPENVRRLMRQLMDAEPDEDNE